MAPVQLLPEHQFKVPVVRRPEYTLFLEQATRHHTFIHCTVHRSWSREIKRRLMADWQVLKDLAGVPLFALHTPGDLKHLKFLRMFGFQLVTSFRGATDDGPREIYCTQD